VNFVIDEDAQTVLIKEERAVVRCEISAGDLVRGIHWRFPFNDAGEERMLEIDGQLRSGDGELRILKGEWCGRFRPNQQVWLHCCGGETDSADFREV
jgi:hypothetical protein